MNSEALLLGRKTYEGFAEAWPQREGEFADRFNNMPKYVVSSTLKDPEWTNTTVLEGDLAEEVAKLRDELDGEIVVHGSAQLVQGLIENGLVDELRLMVFPVVLGSGKRLFGETSDKQSLQAHGLEARGRRRGDPDVPAGLLRPLAGARKDLIRASVEVFSEVCVFKWGNATSTGVGGATAGDRLLARLRRQRLRGVPRHERPCRLRLEQGRQPGDLQRER